MGPVDFMGAPGLSSGLTPMWPFGLLSSLGATSATSAVRFYWWAKCSPNLQGEHGCTWSKPLSFTVTVTSGTALASATVLRGPAAPVTASFERVAVTGFYGVFWQPAAGHDNHIGILESSGPLDIPVGAMLAARGYPTLDLAYYGEPGLPQAAKDLSLEYSAKALRWLGAQPGVDPKRLWVMGWSTGSEAALLLGVRYPDLVHGVAVLSFDDVASCNGYGQGSPTWTYGGKPLPCTNQFPNPHPTDNPAAVIPVAKIHGPLFLGCGERDSWSSCSSYAKAVMAALAAAHYSYPHELLEYPDAGHALGALLPYDPGIAAYEDGLTPPEWPPGFNGTSNVSNPLARADQWPKLLAFLRN
jgi:dienelactone hydrolase